MQFILVYILRSVAVTSNTALYITIYRPTCIHCNGTISSSMYSQC